MAAAVVGPVGTGGGAGGTGCVGSLRGDARAMDRCSRVPRRAAAAMATGGNAARLPEGQISREQ
jgi:hypothetical protein